MSCLRFWHSHCLQLWIVMLCLVGVLLYILCKWKEGQQKRKRVERGGRRGRWEERRDRGREEAKKR